MSLTRLYVLAGVLPLALAACRSGNPPSWALVPAPVSCGAAIAGEEQLTAPLILVGEIHGTEETPAAFGHLVCRAAAEPPGNTVLVGLEILSNAQAAIDAFLAGKGDAPATQALLAHDFWQREYQDGRSSRAMFDLLEALRRYRKAGLKIEVRALDPPEYKVPGDRDAGMAASLAAAIAAVRPAQTFVLVGNVHSRTLPGYPWNANASYVSLGVLLEEKFPDLIALDVANAGGTAWMCTSADAAGCGAKPLGARETTGTIPRIELDPSAAPTSGHSGVLRLGPVTASPPARDAAP